jgi:hypothetical protein
MPRTSRLLIYLCAASLSFVPGTISGQVLQRSARLSVDNDYFDLWLPTLERPDDNYTHGVRFGWDITSVPGFARKTMCGRLRACGLSLEIGQQIYTPTVDNPFPLPGERPYAGWLYGSARVRSGTAKSLRSFGLTIGTTGPPSLAEDAQVKFHKRFGFRRPLGWEYQLGTERAFALSGAQSWRVASPATSFLDFIPTVSGNLGTVRTSIVTAGRLRVGPQLTHPWLSERQRTATLSAFVGGHVEAVARDLFLNGNTFKESVRVDGRSIRTETSAGVTATVGRLGVEYEVIRQGREYRHGPKSHAYGSVSFRWRLD